MSLRQVRKLKKQESERQTSNSSADEHESFPPKRGNLFAMLREDSEASKSSSDSEAEPTPQPQRQPKSVAKKKQKPTREARPKAVIEDADDLDAVLAELAADEPAATALSEAVLNPQDARTIFRLERAAMNPEHEARRQFGAQGRAPLGSSRARTGHVRKFVFLTPPSEWPRVRGNLRMEKREDGEFELRSSDEYEKQLTQLFEISEVQSFELLIDFIHRHPFHIHALLSAVEVFRQVRQYEQAMDVLKRAIYSLECDMHYEFEPSKAPILSESSVFNLSLLEALLLYVHLLVGQGCLETALEISKFLVVIDRMSDRTHSMLRVDLLAVRAKKWDLLEIWNKQFFEEKFFVSDVLPNWAFSVALGRYLRLPDFSSGLQVNAVTIDCIIDCSDDENISQFLIKAIIKFGIVVKALVAKWQDKTRLDWLRLFSQAPFSEALEGFPAEIGRIAEAYAEHSAAFWRPDVLQGWLFACAEKAVALSSDPRILEYRKREVKVLRTREGLTLLGRYKEVVSAEFNANISDFVLPKVFRDNDDLLMSIYRPNAARYPSHHDVGGPANVSLDSNPLFVFLQTLMPWARVDTAGTQAVPMTVAGLLDRLRDAFGQQTPVVALGQPGGTNHPASDESDSEIDMDHSA